MSQLVSQDVLNIGARGLASGATAGLLARYIFEETGPVNIPLIGNVDVGLVIGLSGAIASMVSDSTEQFVFRQLPVNIQSQRFASFAVKSALAGASFAVPLKLLVPETPLDFMGIVQTFGLGAVGKFGGDYLADNVILKSQRGFII